MNIIVLSIILIATVYYIVIPIFQPPLSIVGIYISNIPAVIMGSPSDRLGMEVRKNDADGRSHAIELLRVNSSGDITRSGNVVILDKSNLISSYTKTYNVDGVNVKFTASTISADMGGGMVVFNKQ